MDDLELLLGACRDECNNLPTGKRTMGEAIHSLVIEVVGSIIQNAMQKKKHQQGNGEDTQ